MLTPEVVKAKEFQASGRGAYRADDVDSFFAEVSASYEQMFKENGELIKKISILANKVEKYKEEEDSIRKVLVSAQTMADKIVKDAETKSQETLGSLEQEAAKKREDAEKQAKDIVEAAKKEAETVILNSKKDADEILGSVNRKVMKESLEFEMLQKKASEFRAHLIATYKEHLNLINQIPEYVEKEMEQTAPEAPKGKPEEKRAAPAEAVTEQPAPAQEPAPAAEPEVKEEAPAAAPAEEPEAAPEQFTLLDTDDEPEAAPAEMEDITSSSEEETAAEAPEEDGFALDFSMIDDDDEDAAAEEPAAAPAHTYAKIEEDDEDDDDSAGSFKSFFKKK